MVKRIFKTLLGILTILSLVLSAYFIYSMVGQYEESVRWGSSSLLSDIHNVPPALAKNYVFGNEERLAQTLTEVNNALDVVIIGKGVPADNIEDYSELCQLADELLKESELEDSDIAKPLRSLQLYIQIEKSIINAYEVVDTENLIKYSDSLVNRLNDRDNELDVVYLNRLGEVAKDYRDLENFSKKALEALGVIEGDTLRVDLKVDKSATDKILNDLSGTQLLKFSNTRRLEAMLRGDPWNDILTHNQSTKDYYSWKKSEAILESLLATNYKPVSDFVNLQDALDYQPNIRLVTRYGYDLDIEDSSILRVYYQGEPLDKDMYIRKGTRLMYDINYAYTKIEVVEPEEFEIEREEIEIDIPNSSDPSDESDDKNNDFPVDKPVNGPDDKSNDFPVDKPVDKPTEIPKGEEVNIPREELDKNNSDKSDNGS